MSRVITFSLRFPAYHPKAGKQTYFVEKIWKGLWDAEPTIYVPFDGYWQRYDQFFPFSEERNNIHKHAPKWHTIRSGHRWKVGDTFSPRIWTAKPYNSMMMTFAPDIEIRKVWKFEITNNNLLIDGRELATSQWFDLALNDGLSVSEMLNWFKYPNEFSGQVICWKHDLEY